MGTAENFVAEVKGMTGTMTAYTDKVIIRTNTIFGKMHNGKLEDRVFSYDQIVDVKFSRPSLSYNGYLQLIIDPNVAVKQDKNFFGGNTMDSIKDPNSIALRAFSSKPAKNGKKVYDYIKSRIHSDFK